MRKKVLRAAVFILIVALLLVYLNQVFTIADSDSNKQIFNAFYSEEENTIDAVYFGTSASNRYFIPPIAYEETGMTVFTLATMGMPMFLIPTLMDEVEKTQDPKLYIIELRWALKDKDLITDAHIRRVTDSMKISPNRAEAIENSLKFTEGAEGEFSNIDSKLDYYISLIKYHSRLETGDLTMNDILLAGTENQVKGYVTTKNTVTQVVQKPAIYSDERTALSPEADQALTELLDYCDGLDQDIIFVIAPYSVKEGQMGKFNTAVDMVEERGYNVINFNNYQMFKTLGLVYETDFYNSKHVNYLGAEKYTDYLTKYIDINYSLPNHKDEAGYESWGEAYDYYKDYVKDGIQYRK
ncbi:MAG: hypothetical protein GX663_10145 [Clostridiales bacterium]|nr:hypothetical protein [Clostridiales bacterium]